MSRLRTLGPKGDVITEWNPDVKDEAQETAKKEFDILARAGFALFEVPKEGMKPEGPVRAFNPAVHEIVAIPQIQGG